MQERQVTMKRQHQVKAPFSEFPPSHRDLPPC